MTYAVLKMIKLVLVLCIYTHWQACAWGLVSSYMEGGGEETWLTAFDDTVIGLGKTPTSIDRYVAALYWSMMTVTGIGYGDMLPVNTLERVFCTLWMLMSGAMWAYVIGTVSMIATTLDPNGVVFQNTSACSDLNQGVLRYH